jgi:carotenoid cleavage dioxygenase
MEPLRFPDIPLYSGWGIPMRAEVDLRGVEVVQGRVPDGLNGAWYRVGPDRQFPPMLGDDIFIDGEGMIHMFRFDDGQVDYRSRWVRNERFLLQEKAKRSLFGRYRNRYTNDPAAAGAHMGTANTSALFHGGKFLVLKEDDLPYEVDPLTLATGRKYDYEGQVRSLTMTAHPKVDLEKQELLTFGFQAKGDATTDIVYYRIGPDRRIRDEVWFKQPYACVVHDFAITETHVVFPFFPLITDLEVLKAGGPFYQWHPDKPTVVAVLPREGATERDIRWFTGSPTSAGHMMNAVTRGNEVHLDLCLYEGNCFPFFPTPKNEYTQPVPPILTRMSFDLSGRSDGIEKRPLFPDAPGEMPKTDDRFQGRTYRDGYMIVYRAKDGSSSLGHVDMGSGKLKVWSPGPGSAIQEPQFVPRRADSPEGDGWLLVLVNRLDTRQSDLVVIDAQDIEAGPVATLRLPVRVRSTFHGTWVPADALAA